MKNIKAASLIQWSLVIAFSVFLSSCTSVQETKLTRQELPETFGVVAVQVVSNSIRLTPMLRQWNYITVADAENPENIFRLEPHGTGLIR
ncbi:MAG: hypothetical protein AAF446_11815, partial [Pseudomonadota bacterium]